MQFGDLIVMVPNNTGTGMPALAVGSAMFFVVVFGCVGLGASRYATTDSAREIMMFRKNPITSLGESRLSWCITQKVS
jgi:hypothetical protein